MAKTLTFRGNSFTAEKIVKNEKSIILYDANNDEIYRFQPLSKDLSEYVITNADGTTGTYDNNDFSANVISTGTDVFRLVYALMKEIDDLTDEVNKLKGSAN